MTFSNVPSFYAVAASRPLDEALSPGAAALYRIGTTNLKLESKLPVTGERVQRFAKALIEEQQRARLIGVEIRKIACLGDRLFRVEVAFPANQPTGDYRVVVFLAKDRDVVDRQTT